MIARAMIRRRREVRGALRGLSGGFHKSCRQNREAQDLLKEVPSLIHPHLPVLAMLAAKIIHRGTEMLTNWISPEALKSLNDRFVVAIMLEAKEGQADASPRSSGS